MQSIRETHRTDRLTLRRPVVGDAGAMFDSYTSDPEVARYLAWRCHDEVAQTRGFLGRSDQIWARDGMGPLLIVDHASGAVLGSTGLDRVDDETAITGYCLARAAWGKGLATEVLRAVVAIARGAGARELQAYVHTDHRASAHVLEKVGFTCTSSTRLAVFPNLGDDPVPVRDYAIALRP